MKKISFIEIVGYIATIPLALYLFNLIMKAIEVAIEVVTSEVF